tara:strand:- start:233 stop:490 length:258 start_codon:yes stop_codon:yes gene_type:complete
MSKANKKPLYEVWEENLNKGLIPVYNYSPNDEIKTKWVDISDLGKKYFLDLSIDCQNFVMDAFQYEPLDFDEKIVKYNNIVKNKS